MRMAGQAKGGVMRIVRHVLRAGIWVTFALLTPAAASAADTPDLGGQWKRNPELSQDAVSKVFASLPPEGRGFSHDEQRFHDALLHFAKVIDSLQIEQTAEDVKIILAGDEVQIYYLGRAHVRQGVLGAGWRFSRAGGETSWSSRRRTSSASSSRACHSAVKGGSPS
jgi:hypothetical protein